MPMAQRGGVPAVRGGLPTMAQGEYQGPYGAYGEFRDVTGNILSGPAMEAENALRAGGIPFGKIAAGAAGVGLPFMAAYYGRDGGAPAARDVGGAMAAPTARGAQQLPPIDVYGRPQQRPVGSEMAESMGGAAGQKAKGGKGGKTAPMPAKRPAEVAPADEWEGNLNYKITQMFDKLFGQDEAERGRKTQQYYEQNP